MRYSLLLAATLALSTSVWADTKGPNLERRAQVEGGGASVMGNLDGSATYDRRFLVTYDGSCAAASSDSSNNGTSFQTFDVRSPSGQNMDAEVVLGTLNDSVLFVYCPPFNPADPATNIRAWDDDGGVGFGSAIVAADGVVMEPNQVYTLVVTSFSQGDAGTYTLNLGGDLQFVGQEEQIFAEPAPMLNWQSGLLVTLLVGVIGVVAVHRRA
ncbi:MAG: hypothetical protein KDI71_08030 [Xanthomonadales bacterium]|nr:hypothetical protein [Xanthomonadales bacterium]